MTRSEKLMERICRRPPEARFSDVRALLEACGWKQDRQSGSHVTFVKSGEFPITVPVHDKKVGRVYLADICERLEIECARES